MTETVTITVHVCSVCGDHSREVAETDSDIDDGHVYSYYIEDKGLVLAPCETCGILACRSCMDDGYCCDRRAEIESEGLPERALLGQQGLFE